MARATWTSRLTYVLTVAGATIGFGATWRFPYLVGENGGGAYVLTFVLVMFLVGVPIILVENVIGRRAQSNTVDAFIKASKEKKLHKAFTILGYMACFGAFGILAYYMVIGGWVITYIVHIILGLFNFAHGLDLSTPITKEVTEQFYIDYIENNALLVSFYTFLFVACNYLILKNGVIKGIERVVKYLMPLLFFCLILMVVRNITLDGAKEGIIFYLSPDFSKITPKLLLDVLGQVFFALSLGFGVMITLSSHLNAKEDLKKTATITAIINTLIAVLAGFMIFPSLFTANLEPNSGPSLVFKSLPIAFSNIHFGNIFAIVFFVLLLIAALTTSITIYQVIISVLTEKFGFKLKSAINLTLGAIFIFGNIPCVLGSGIYKDFLILDRNIFDLFDFVSGNIFFVLTALGATLFVGYVLKQEALLELNNGQTKKSALSLLWYAYVRFVAPLIILVIFLYGLL